MTSDRSTTGASTRLANRPAQAGNSPAPQPAQKFDRFTDAEINEANEKLAEAFSFVGCLGDPLRCPECGTTKKKVVVFKVSDSSKPYWKCFKCGSHGSATKLLTDKAGMTFVEAMNVLLGRDSRKVEIKDLPVTVIAQTFRAVVDIEVYDFIRAAGSVEAAQRYWATWHLDPDVVADSGSTMITDPAVVDALLTTELDSSAYKSAWRRHVVAVRKVHDELQKRFGMDRLKAAGIAMEVEDRNGTGTRDLFLVNENFPVIEVHESPTGRVVGMQFRPVGRTKAKIDAHKAWKRRWEADAARRWPDDPEKKAHDAWSAAYAEDPQAAGPKHEFERSLMGIRGAGQDSLVGCGLRRIASLPDPSTVKTVEGFKDVLAERTMGHEAYGMPGTGNLPPARTACRVLERHDNLVTLDGDAAGDKARDVVLEHYAATRRFIVGVTVSAEGAPRLAEALRASEDVSAMFETPAVSHREDGNVWVAGRPVTGATPRAIMSAVAKVARVPANAVVSELRGVRARKDDDVREGRDSTDVLVERVAHTGCGCPTCRDWRASNPATPEACTCAVCQARRDGHTFSEACKCGACLAVKARQATDAILNRYRKRQ